MPSGRMYSTSFVQVAATAQTDFFELLAGTGKPIQIHSVHLSQDTEIGDAQAEMVPFICKRVTGAPTSGSGGSTHTPTPLNPNDTASGATSEINNTTKLTGGTATTIHAAAFHVATGIDLIWTPETRPVIDAATRFVIEVKATPADSITLSGTVYFEELV